MPVLSAYRPASESLKVILIPKSVMHIQLTASLCSPIAEIVQAGSSKVAQMDVIPVPRGTAGVNYKLQAVMGLGGDDRLYSSILVSEKNQILYVDDSPIVPAWYSQSC